MVKMIEKLEGDSEYGMHIPFMKKLHTLKHKDVLRETCLELQRRGGNFVCIYPALGSENYD
jgi:hypothetical protein